MPDNEDELRKRGYKPFEELTPEQQEAARKDARKRRVEIADNWYLFAEGKAGVPLRVKASPLIEPTLRGKIAVEKPFTLHSPYDPKTGFVTYEFEKVDYERLEAYIGTTLTEEEKESLADPQTMYDLVKLGILTPTPETQVKIDAIEAEIKEATRPAVTKAIEAAGQPPTDPEELANWILGMWQQYPEWMAEQFTKDTRRYYPATSILAENLEGQRFLTEMGYEDILEPAEAKITVPSMTPFDKMTQPLMRGMPQSVRDSFLNLTYADLYGTYTRIGGKDVLVLPGLWQQFLDDNPDLKEYAMMGTEESNRLLIAAEERVLAQYAQSAPYIRAFQEASWRDAITKNPTLAANADFILGVAAGTGAPYSEDPYTFFRDIAQEQDVDMPAESDIARIALERSSQFVTQLKEQGVSLETAFTPEVRESEAFGKLMGFPEDIYEQFLTQNFGIPEFKALRPWFPYIYEYYKTTVPDQAFASFLESMGKTTFEGFLSPQEQALKRQYQPVIFRE